MPESQPPFFAPQHRPSPWTLLGLILDRCHEPCPSVIPNTDQPRPNQDLARTGISPIPSCSKSTSSLLSLDPVLPQCWPDPDYCYLESVIRVKPRQLHQMAVSTNPSSGGRVIQCHYLWGYSENYGGFQGYSPFQLLLICYLVSRILCNSLRLIRLFVLLLCTIDVFNLGIPLFLCQKS